MDVGLTLPWWSVVPFAGMLLSIAVFPLVKPVWWEKRQLHVAAFWSAVFLVPFALAYGLEETGVQLAEVVVLDYVPFIVLLLGLFVVSGGIHVKGTMAGTTKNNVVLLAIGTLLASWVGTTGAAMLLIRPVLRANAWRRNKTHIVVFFIFLVANIGGCLTPLGDPPLFFGLPARRALLLDAPAHLAALAAELRGAPRRVRARRPALREEGGARGRRGARAWRKRPSSACPCASRVCATCGIWRSSSSRWC